VDFESAGFDWIDCTDSQSSVVSFLRRGRNSDDVAVFVCNFTPVPHHAYRIGVPRGGFWKERVNSDASLYGGSGQGNVGGAEAIPVPMHGRPYSLDLTLPPLATMVFQPGS